MKKGILIVFSLLFFVTCKPKAEGVISISTEDLKIQLQQGIQLVDVRTPKEWEAGIIEGALQVSVTSENFETQILEKLDKSKPVCLYCRSGIRSVIAAEILYQKGYKVYSLEGGYNDWKDKI